MPTRTSLKAQVVSNKYSLLLSVLLLVQHFEN